MASFRSSSVLMPMLFLTTFLFLNKMVNSTKSLSFSFPEFVPQQPDLIFQGHAVVAPTGRLYLNQQAQGSTGRALYAAPVQIWDSKTGNVASFTTSFSFSIYNIKGIPADGLAFFLAPVDSQAQVSGGLLGLFPDEDVHQSNQVVAVEFDTFSNGWDPEGRHIGIDVNGIKSVNTTSWSFWSQVVANVTISYEASTKVLAVFSIYPSTHQRYRVSSVVDIKNVLPEFVRVGFSASSGVHTGRHDVLSWSFESKLPSSADSTKGHDGAFNNVHVSSLNHLDSLIYFRNKTASYCNACINKTCNNGSLSIVTCFKIM